MYCRNNDNNGYALRNGNSQEQARYSQRQCSQQNPERKGTRSKQGYIFLK